MRREEDQNSTASSFRAKLAYPEGNAKSNVLFVATIALAAVGIGLLVSTIVLALKLNGSYPSARVKYYVWDNQDLLQANQRSLNVKAPHNATFFTVMEHAALEHKHFEFEYKQYEFGKSVQSIGGVKENMAENIFWMIYKLDTTPSREVPPSNEYLTDFGIDDIRVDDNDIYLFRLMKVQFQEHKSNFQFKVKSHVESLAK